MKLAFAVITVAAAYGGEPELLWTSGFPSGGESSVRAAAVLPTGRIAAVGEITMGSSGRKALIAAVLSPLGEVEWEFTDLSLGDATANGIAVADHGFAVSGSVRNSSGEEGVVLRFSEDGGLIWRSYAGFSESSAFTAITRAEGGFLAVGHTREAESGSCNAMAVMFSDTGTVAWSRAFLSDGDQSATCVTRLQDMSGFIITGSDGDDVFLMKIDSGGNWVWRNRHSAQGRQTSSGLTVLADGGYIVSGGTRSGGLFPDALLVFFDENGTPVGERSWGGSGPDMARFAAEIPPAGFVVLSNSNSGDGTGYRPVLTRFDPWLSTVWSLTLTDTDSFGHVLALTAEGGFVVAGMMSAPGVFGQRSFIMRLSPEDLHNW